MAVPDKKSQFTIHNSPITIHPLSMAGIVIKPRARISTGTIGFSPAKC